MLKPVNIEPNISRKKVSFKDSVLKIIIIKLTRNNSFIIIRKLKQ